MVCEVLILLLVSVICAADNAGPLRCPRGIRSFSHVPEGSSYYQCSNDNQAVLQRCPRGKIYMAKKQGCYKSMLRDSSNKIEHRATLSVPTYLGDFYDIHHNEIQTDDSLWDRKSIDAKKHSTNTPSLEVHVFKTKSTIDRLKWTKLVSEMKADFAGGSAQVDGGSLYLKDQLKSTQEAVVILTYEALTVTDTMPRHIKPDYECRNGPTHVITGVTYGASANFVFRKTVRRNESMHHVEEELLEAVQRIKEGFHTKEATKTIVQDLNVDFYADFVPEHQPSTYVESKETYRSLPRIIGKHNTSIPMYIQLTPIQMFCPDSETKTIQVSDDLLDGIQRMVMELEMNYLVVRTLQQEEVARDYAPLRGMLDLLERRMSSFHLKIKREIQITLPIVRRGNGSEELLVKLLNTYQESPFYNEKLSLFLKNRRREIKRLNLVLEPGKFKNAGVKVVSYEDVMDMSAVFSKDFVLLVRLDILPSKELVEKYLNGEDIDERKSWYNNPFHVSLMGRTIRQLVTFADRNFDLKDHAYLFGIGDAKGSNIVEVVFQKEGLLYTVDLPEIPPLPSLESKTHETAVIDVLRPSDSWVTGIKVTYWQQGSTSVKDVSQSFAQRNNTKVTLRSLSAGVMYEYSVAHLTPMGVSKQSETGSFITYGCSPPRNVRTTGVGANSLQLMWDAPAVCGANTRVEMYNISIIDVIRKSETFFREEHSKSKSTVDGLRDSSTYSIRISAICHVGEVNRTGYITTTLPSSTLATMTLPSTPTHLSLIYRTNHAAMVSWIFSKRIGGKGKMIGYRVRYQMMNNVGESSANGTIITVMTGNESYVMKDLRQGTSYAVSVQVVTTVGSSAYSPNLILRTTFEKTQLDRLHETINREIKIGEDQLKASIKAVNHTFGEKLEVESKVIENTNHSLRTLVNKVKDSFQADLKAETDERKAEVKALDKRAELLEIAKQHSIQAFYPQYGLRFVGVGHYSSRGKYVGKHVASLDECLKYCYDNKRSEGWNGLCYHTSDKYCECDAQDSGHRQDPYYLHFKFV